MALREWLNVKISWKDLVWKLTGKNQSYEVMEITYTRI